MKVKVKVKIKAKVKIKVKALLISLLKLLSLYNFIIFIFSSIKRFNKRYKFFSYILAFVKFILNLIFLNLINNNIIFIFIKKKTRKRFYYFNLTMNYIKEKKNKKKIKRK